MPNPTLETPDIWACPIDFDAPAFEALASISKSHALLLQTAQDFEYQHVIPEHIESHFKSLDRSHNRSQKEKLEATLFLPLIYNRGDAVQLLTTFQQSRKLLVVHLLNAAKIELETGNLLLPLICFRCIIEHCAHQHDAIRTIDITDTPETLPAAAEVLKNSLVKIKKVLLGTRFDWWGVDGLKPDELDSKLGNRKYEYKHEPDGKRIDLTAKQIMTSIDKLERTIPKIRGTYELLCEFAHPNLGGLYTITTKTTQGVCKQGIHWDSMTIGLGKPKIPDCLRSAFIHIFVKMAEVLQTFEADQTRLSQLKAKLVRITQVCVRQDLKDSPVPVVIDRYCDCPCASGEKFKFCCYQK